MCCSDSVRSTFSVQYPAAAAGIYTVLYMGSGSQIQSSSLFLHRQDTASAFVRMVKQHAILNQMNIKHGLIMLLKMKKNNSEVLI